MRRLDVPGWARRNGWSREKVLTAIGLSFAAVLVTFDAWADIYDFAMRDEEASHIFLVPVIAGWLFWVRRERLRQTRLVRTWVGPVVVGIGWLLYSLGDLSLVQAAWHAGAVMVVVGALLSVAGGRILARFLPAFVILAFLVPVPGLARQEIAIPLQAATAKATHTVLEVIGIASERTGNVLIINGTQVAIAEACNGLRMVFALLLVCVAFAFGTPLRWHARVLVILLAPVSAIACNVIRLVPTVWFYGYRSKEFADWFHDFSGWVMLPVAFLILMGIIRVLRWALVPVHRYTLAHGA